MKKTIHNEYKIGASELGRPDFPNLFVYAGLLRLDYRSDKSKFVKGKEKEKKFYDEYVDLISAKGKFVPQYRRKYGTYSLTVSGKIDVLLKNGIIVELKHTLHINDYKFYWNYIQAAFYSVQTNSTVVLTDEDSSFFIKPEEHKELVELAIERVNQFLILFELAKDNQWIVAGWFKWILERLDWQYTRQQKMWDKIEAIEPPIKPIPFQMLVKMIDAIKKEININEVIRYGN
jgi:hypothetical protein